MGLSILNRRDKNVQEYKAYFILGAVCFFLGGAIAIGAGYYFTRDSGTKLNADLKDARWSLESATRTNAELATGLRELHGELDRASGLTKKQQSIIDSQQSRLDEQKQIIDGQQSIIDGIAETIREQGGDIRGKIKAIADGFGRLYAFYHEGGSTR